MSAEGEAFWPRSVEVPASTTALAKEAEQWRWTHAATSSGIGNIEHFHERLGVCAHRARRLPDAVSTQANRAVAQLPDYRYALVLCHDLVCDRTARFAVGASWSHA